MLALLALLHVAAEEECTGDNRNDEEDHGGGPDLEELDDRKPERRGRQRSDGRGDERAQELRCVETLLGDGDNGRDEHDADDMGDGAGEQNERPDVRRRIAWCRERPENEQRNPAAKR